MVQRVESHDRLKVDFSHCEFVFPHPQHVIGGSSLTFRFQHLFRALEFFHESSHSRDPLSIRILFVLSMVSSLAHRKFFHAQAKTQSNVTHASLMESLRVLPLYVSRAHVTAVVGFGTTRRTFAFPSPHRRTERVRRFSSLFDGSSSFRWSKLTRTFLFGRCPAFSDSILHGPPAHGVGQ